MKAKTIDEDLIWENKLVLSSINIFFKLIESLKDFVLNLFKNN